MLRQNLFDTNEKILLHTSQLPPDCMIRAKRHCNARLISSAVLNASIMFAFAVLVIIIYTVDAIDT